MPTFTMTMDIDDKGVVVAVFEGAFEASEWLRQRRSVFESRYAPAEYDGRPIVIDMRRCLLPDRDWSTQFQDIGQALKQRRTKSFRSAIVLADQLGADNAVALFAAYQKIFHHPGAETRGFRSYEEAHAWALEGLQEHFPETSKAPEKRSLREARDGAGEDRRE